MLQTGIVRSPSVQLVTHALLTNCSIIHHHPTPLVPYQTFACHYHWPHVSHNRTSGAVGSQRRWRLGHCALESDVLRGIRTMPSRLKSNHSSHRSRAPTGVTASNRRPNDITKSHQGEHGSYSRHEAVSIEIYTADDAGRVNPVEKAYRTVRDTCLGSSEAHLPTRAINLRTHQTR